MEARDTTRRERERERESRASRSTVNLSDRPDAVHAIPVDIIDAWSKVLKTDNAGRSTAPQKGPIRSNLRGSSIGPSARSNGQRLSPPTIEFRDLFLLLRLLLPLLLPSSARGEELYCCAEKKHQPFYREYWRVRGY